MLGTSTGLFQSIKNRFPVSCNTIRKKMVGKESSLEEHHIDFISGWCAFNESISVFIAITSEVATLQENLLP